MEVTTMLQIRRIEQSRRRRRPPILQRPHLRLAPTAFPGLPFGSSESTVVDMLSESLGEPTEFTDYLPDYCGTGEGEIGRELSWGPLVILLNNESEGGYTPA